MYRLKVYSKKDSQPYCAGEEKLKKLGVEKLVYFEDKVLVQIKKRVKVKLAKVKVSNLSRGDFIQTNIL